MKNPYPKASLALTQPIGAQTERFPALFPIKLARLRLPFADQACEMVERAVVRRLGVFRETAARKLTALEMIRDAVAADALLRATRVAASTSRHVLRLFTFHLNHSRGWVEHSSDKLKPYCERKPPIRQGSRWNGDAKRWQSAIRRCMMREAFLAGIFLATAVY